MAQNLAKHDGDQFLFAYVFVNLKKVIMTELRTTIKAEESWNILQLMIVTGRNINPLIEIRTEIFRESVLVRVIFTAQEELDRFLGVLADNGVELKKWAKYDEEAAE